jgi:hypothetical protein
VLVKLYNSFNFHLFIVQHHDQACMEFLPQNWLRMRIDVDPFLGIYGHRIEIDIEPYCHKALLRLGGPENAQD